jgi:FMN-dependent NADH-azoreductase
MKKLLATPQGIQEVDLTVEEIAQVEKDKIESIAKKQAEQKAKAQKEADALAGNNKLLRTWFNSSTSNCYDWLYTTS